MKKRRRRQWTYDYQDSDDQVMQQRGVSAAEMRRQVHIQSEQKRRAQIKDGFDVLRQHLPGCANKKMSKAALLGRTVQHLQHLKKNQMAILTEIERLVQENEKLKSTATASSGSASAPPNGTQENQDPANSRRKKQTGNVTFLKRKHGLMKKAYELSVLCNCEIALLIFNTSGKLIQYASSDIDQIMMKYTEYTDLHETKSNQDFINNDDVWEEGDETIEHEPETHTEKDQSARKEKTPPAPHLIPRPPVVMTQQESHPQNAWRSFIRLCSTTCDTFGWRLRYLLCYKSNVCASRKYEFFDSVDHNADI
ncbi:hypothetical protein G6F42_020418 [Rhizopus arrhizus]|nr:hypothetical protein G6F42_020418 [Rhizopus arrhizus]